jgi:hypothetical protein
MERVDILIGIVGVLALLATGLGIALYDDGETAYVVRDATADLGSQGPATADTQGTEFAFELPDNALGATFEVTVTAGGQAPTGGAVSVTLVVDEPDGTTSQNTFSFDYAQGSGTGTVTTEGAWTERPEDFRGDEADVEARTKAWPEGVVVTVFVDGPCAGPLPLPVCFDTYEATVAGMADVYQITFAVPDVESR